MQSSQRAAILAAAAILAMSGFALSQTRQEFRFKVGHKTTVSIANQYGPVSVKPIAGKLVVVTATVYSDKVEIDQHHSGKRVSVLSHLLPGATPETGRVDYEVLVPSNATVSIRSATGPVHIEKLNGDVSLEGATANVEVRDLTSAHVHVRSMDGPVTLTNISDGNVEITSVRGDVIMNAVNVTRLQVNSTSGKINYAGDFGDAGEYILTSHTGDIEATAPAYASFDVTARSEHGQVQNDFPLAPEHTSFVVRAGSAFAGTMNKAASSVKLLSFSGKIHLKKR
jgi:hypothetical protein